MNKQELIKRIDKLPYFEGPIADTVTVNREWILKSIQQLDESQKVIVPQFVADVIEGAREKSPELEDALHYTWGNGSREFTEWYKKKSNRDCFARAWLDGYTVKKEKRYYVKAKKIANGCNYLNCRTSKNEWSFASIGEPIDYRTRHTRKELEEAGFGWVFDCPGVEVEEVEE